MNYLKITTAVTDSGNKLGEEIKALVSTFTIDQLEVEEFEEILEKVREKDFRVDSLSDFILKFLQEDLIPVVPSKRGAGRPKGTYTKGYKPRGNETYDNN
jgi:hypothetical protein